MNITSYTRDIRIPFPPLRGSDQFSVNSDQKKLPILFLNLFPPQIAGQKLFDSDL
jgi:hypothetical protein